MASGDPVLEQHLRERIRDIPDFPKPGILFKDLTPVMADGPLFARIVDEIAARYAGEGIEQIVAIESRGFIFAAPVAVRLGCGFVPVRKPGKLPWQTVREDYDLEYGTDALEAHSDAILPGQRILLLDDVLATGGTAAACARVIRQLGGEIVAAAFVVELGFLDGRSRLHGMEVLSLVRY